MNFIHIKELIINPIVSFLVGSICGWFVRWLMKNFKNRKIKKFFPPNKKYSIILSAKKEETPGKSLKGSISEVYAYARINSFLSRIGVETEIENGYFNIETSNNNLFILGGNRYNPASNIVWDKLCNGTRPNPLIINLDNSTIIIGKNTYEISYTESTKEMITYSIVFKIDNPFGENKSGYIFASLGLNGYGTLGGAEALCNTCYINKHSKKNQFIAVIKSQFKDGYFVDFSEIYSTEFK